MRKTYICIVGAIFVMSFGVSQAKAQAARTVIQTVLSQLAPNKQLPADLTLTGQVTTASGTLPFQITIRGKDQARYEIGLGPTAVTTIVSKGTGWRTIGDKTQFLEYSTLQRPVLMPFLDLLAEADTPALQIVDRGAVRLGQANTVRYTLKLPDPKPRTARLYARPLDEEADLYVDPVSLLVVRSERWEMADNSMDVRFRHITEFLDYRNVQGFAVPYRVVETVNPITGPPVQAVYVVLTATINSGVDDSIFAAPERRP